jgi:aspartyl aminopeptidase
MSLKYEKKDVYSMLDEEKIKEANVYSKEYIDFLNEGKTEYLCVKEAIKMLDANGFTDISKRKKLQVGDKVYFVNKEKSLFVAVIGNKKLVEGFNIIGAHIDSPRLDLKPFPLFERQNIAAFKTQYYGGIKKYQWLSIPLAMHGVVYNENNEEVIISVGESEDDPCFTIADLLPHLAKDQMDRKANEFIDPEKMSILVGNTKIKDAKDNCVKENVLKILDEKYGIKEIDFARSDISFVPAFKAKYVGIDRSMIGGYGQDDRVCAFATLKAIMDLVKEEKNIEKTVIAMIVDKEEIGSVGNTSMSSSAFDMFVNKIISKKDIVKEDILEVYYNSKMLSADVTAAVDVDYEEVHDVQNGSLLGSGVSVEKYGGSGGKGGASEASAKYVSEVMKIFDDNNVKYQVGTLGKIGKGGGGTIAYILAKKGVDVVDCGTAILAMHSPFEISNKYDVYMTYLAYKAFFKS